MNSPYLKWSRFIAVDFLFSHYFISKYCLVHNTVCIKSKKHPFVGFKLNSPDLQTKGLLNPPETDIEMVTTYKTVIGYVTQNHCYFIRSLKTI